MFFKEYFSFRKILNISIFRFMIKRDSEDQILLNIKKLFLLLRAPRVHDAKNLLISRCFSRNILRFEKFSIFQPNLYRNLMLTASIFLSVQHLHNFFHKWIHKKFRYCLSEYLNHLRFLLPILTIFHLKTEMRLHLTISKQIPQFFFKDSSHWCR